MIYLDASALVKVVVREDESEALAAWLHASAAPPTSSVIARVESVRAVRRADPQLLPALDEVLRELDWVPASDQILDRAGILGNTDLRSLDAIHLASAMQLGDDLTSFVAYDRPLDAAQAAGLLTSAPGQRRPG